MSIREGNIYGVEEESPASWPARRWRRGALPIRLKRPGPLLLPPSALGARGLDVSKRIWISWPNQKISILLGLATKTNIPLAFAPSSSALAAWASPSVVYSTMAKPVDRPLRSYWEITVSGLKGYIIIRYLPWWKDLWPIDQKARKFSNHRPMSANAKA